ncbi:MerR family transcriptional regulator [Halodesulfovibrio marinisediminis]|uniref:MerR HTH family regulatory protein n=1 Tax=Halodesulfovibrio marinisediminis DSM 17456 TaxID=1121457 RepID=A0A1N6FAQ2_9BACT|nr:MerR family transcriptional regulator [Halodesulfovibrio marinisediminis]SIN92266.1 MerR HTH family regulatory protein [Halodesulfovibrio marinisediminis DSM 17456]
MSQMPLTHKRIARILGVSETTVKSYRRKFPDCIPVASKGKPIQFTEEALEVCRIIRDLFSSGLSVEETHVRLAELFDFISPPAFEEPEEENEVVEVVLPDDYKQAMSSLATSMVNLSLKQEQMLKKMSVIESRLQQLGLADVSAATPSSDPVLAELQALTERTEALWSAVSKLSSSDVTSEQDGSCQQFDEQAQKAKVHRLVPLREVISHDPPRKILTMPLLIQESEGVYTPLHGRGNSRITLNDLRASLMTHFVDEDAYTIRWSENNSGWQLDLLQERAQVPHNICLTMAQTSTLRGSVMVIKDMTTNGHEITPGALQDFISDVYSR